MMDYEDGCITISIPKYQIAHQKGLFARQYTVYEILIEFHNHIQTVCKRYKQFHKLQKQIGKNYLQLLPEFPKKKWDLITRNKKSLVEERCQKLQVWLVAALQNENLRRQILEFLQVPTERHQKIIKLYGSCSLKQGDVLIATLIRDLKFQSHNKLKVLRTFERDYLTSSKNAGGRSLVYLIRTLCPLSGTPGLASKALNLLYKLTTREYNSKCEVYKRNLAELDLEMLRKLSLEKHLTRQFQGDAQVSALEILKIIWESFDGIARENCIQFILNQNEHAIQQFEYWINQSIKPQKNYETSQQLTSNDWIQVLESQLPGNLQMQYRINDQILEMYLQLDIQCNIDYLCQLIINPDQFEWHICLDRLEILEKQNENYQIQRQYFFYEGNRFDIVFEVSKIQDTGKTIIRFNRILDFPENQQKRLFSQYTISEVSESDINYFNFECSKSSRYLLNKSGYNDLGSNDNLLKNSFEVESFDLDIILDIKKYHLELQLFPGSDYSKYAIFELAHENVVLRDSFIGLKRNAEHCLPEDIWKYQKNQVFEALDRKHQQMKRPHRLFKTKSIQNF